jgi:predicted negative regulator of RcsB-dependent stress response
VIDDAIGLVAQTADNCSAAELHRIRGDILMVLSKPRSALASYEQALVIAREQRAKSWEQRILASQAALS